ncbi:XRE family transcriptional regulator [Nocardia yunnanensis]|uniref:XRE family transcriptional regulator n=1 Tax=Nocardia yunnanensis TaxID=2382165 RepID=A0A386ZC52_9NOCA|nr:helix-turn-helix transcriptional regulator [Nocardia yunnanensis]AYF74743.1 XRE family transcriptional regulator [Nocardia yunnanensis]
MSQNGSTIPRRQLGRHLRDLRQQAGMTIASVAKAIERGDSTVQRLETADPAVKIRLWDIEAICRVLGADDTTTEGLKGLAQQANTKHWWHEYGDVIPEDFDVYIGLETDAKQLVSYAELVPGLAQTALFARSLFMTVHPDVPDSEIDRRVEIRMNRQVLFTRKANPIKVDMVLDESALHRMVGGPKIMSAQLRHLAALSTRDNFSIRVLPYSAGFPLGDPTGPFIVLDFGTGPEGQPVEPTVVYVESFTGAMYFTDQRAVDRYQRAAIQHRRLALGEQASRDLLRKAAREFSA